MFIAAAKTNTLRPVLHASTPSNVETNNQRNTLFGIFSCCLRELTVIKELTQRATLSRPPSKMQPASVERL